MEILLSLMLVDEFAIDERDAEVVWNVAAVAALILVVDTVTLFDCVETVLVLTSGMDVLLSVDDSDDEVVVSAPSTVNTEVCAEDVEVAA